MSHLKHDNVRKNVFDFIVERIKKSKQDKDEVASNVISRGPGYKAGILRYLVVSIFTLTYEMQEKIFYSTRTQL